MQLAPGQCVPAHVGAALLKPHRLVATYMCRCSSFNNSRACIIQSYDEENAEAWLAAFAEAHAYSARRCGSPWMTAENVLPAALPACALFRTQADTRQHAFPPHQRIKVAQAILSRLVRLASLAGPAYI